MQPFGPTDPRKSFPSPPFATLAWRPLTGSAAISPSAHSPCRQCDRTVPLSAFQRRHCVLRIPLVHKVKMSQRRHDTGDGKTQDGWKAGDSTLYCLEHSSSPNSLQSRTTPLVIWDLEPAFQSSTWYFGMSGMRGTGNGAPVLSDKGGVNAGCSPSSKKLPGMHSPCAITSRTHKTNTLAGDAGMLRHSAHLGGRTPEGATRRLESSLGAPLLSLLFVDLLYP
jgi:hypothetical protein